MFKFLFEYCKSLSRMRQQNDPGFSVIVTVQILNESVPATIMLIFNVPSN